MKTVYTIGGFKVENFHKLETPIENGILEPHVYQGKISGHGKDGIELGTQNITFDRFGRCYNWQRPDCFIDIKNI